MNGCVGYALRAEYRDAFLPGDLAVANGTFDLKAELEKGDGLLVVPENDLHLIAVLDEYPALKRVAVSREKAEHAEPVDHFEGMTVRQLRDEARKVGIVHPGNSREELLAAVRSATSPEAPEVS